MSCAECQAPIPVWGAVRLCDRCLCARLWEELEADDFLLIRKHPNGDIWVKSQISGNRHATNATALKVDVRAWFEKEIRMLETPGGGTTAPDPSGSDGRASNPPSGVPCPKCRGQGDVHGNPCHRCGGTGDVPVLRHPNGSPVIGNQGPHGPPGPGSEWGPGHPAYDEMGQ